MTLTSGAFTKKVIFFIRVSPAAARVDALGNAMIQTQNHHLQKSET
jgi:hypothetical protein